MRTRVAIVGSGPAGLLLSQILSRHGVESVIVENRSRSYVEARIRAGVIEHGAVDVLTEYGVAERLHREGMRHDGIYLQWPGERHRIDFVESCGHSVWVYGQTELTKDLIELRLADGQQIFWDVSDTAIHGADTERPSVTFVDSDGNQQTIEADYVAGCDGFHGVSRQTIPESVRTVRERVYPYAWLGILAEVAPSTDELIYALHPDGFAMHSMRSDHVSRLYLQVHPDEVIESWSDDRIWTALSTRLGIDGWELESGPTLEKSITPMRSFVSAPMRWGRLFLAGDAAHAMPPWIGQGMCAGVRDVANLCWKLHAVMSGALPETVLDTYQAERLPHVREVTNRAVKVGKVIVDRHPVRAALRRRVFRTASKLPGFNTWLREHRWLPPARYEVGLLVKNGNAATGWLIPQPWVLDSQGERVRFDDVVGGRWTVLHTGADTLAQPWRQAGVPVMRIAPAGSAPKANQIVDCDGALTRWLQDKKTTVVALRPDGFVYAGGDSDHPLPPPPAGFAAPTIRVKDYA